MSTRSAWAALVVAALVTPAALAGQNWKTVTMSRQLQGQDAVDVHVEYGAGEFKVRSLAEGLLYRMQVRYDEDRFEPYADLDGNDLHIGIEGSGRGMGIRRGRSGALDLELARGVPMALELEFGAVQAEMDLGGLALTELELSTGASQSTIDVSEPNEVLMSTASFEVGAAEFTFLNLGNLNAQEIEVDAGVGSITLGLDGEWAQDDAELSIEMGVGALELRVPEGLGIRLHKDSFLTSLDSEGLIKRGDVYESLDFEDADRRVVINLEAAFGSVAIVWTR